MALRAAYNAPRHRLLLCRRLYGARAHLAIIMAQGHMKCRASPGGRRCSRLRNEDPGEYASTRLSRASQKYGFDSALNIGGTWASCVMRHIVKWKLRSELC